MANKRYSLVFRYIHSGLIVFGISSFLTGELAEDSSGIGFWLHAMLGTGLGFVILMRIVFGLSRSNELGFYDWFRNLFFKINLVLEDIKLLIGFKIPERGLHEGIAGLVQAFGLFVFFWMSLTGAFLLFTELSWLSFGGDLMEELHEVGEYLVPLFLILHIGAVVVHTINGHELLKRINPFA